MQAVYMPTDERDLAVQLTISNLVQAGVLAEEDTQGYMSRLFKSDDVLLSVELCNSRVLLDAYLQASAEMNTN